MTKQELVAQIRSKKSFLCVGLDPDFDKIPAEYKKLEDPLFEFNKAVIDATKDFAVAYKPNLAFYECHGAKGIASLQKTLDYIPSNIFTIADAKRGDIGNTSKMYAEAYFKTMGFSSITLSPYMGSDSILPYLDYPNKWVIILAATSNAGAQDFQFIKTENNRHVFQDVLKISSNYGNDGNTMYVLGATRPEILKQAREAVPNHFFLVPGVGAQGGSLEEVYQAGANNEVGLLVNSSRGIIFPKSDNNHKDACREAAEKLQQQMAALMK